MRLEFENTRMLERGLDLAATRHRMIASNIANVDTPGFKPTHIDFESVLAEATSGLELTRTDDRHLRTSERGVKVTVDLSAVRPDGNAVKPEQEMVDLTSNAALYAVFVQALSRRFSGLKAAIMDGRN